MIIEANFDKQRKMDWDDSVPRKYFAMVKTDPIIENYKIIELKESLWPYYNLINYRGIFPLVEYIDVAKAK